MHEIHELVKRINLTINKNSSQELIDASKQDPWIQSGKYSLGWTFFCIVLLVATFLIRVYHLWTDKIRRALHKEETAKASQLSSPDHDYEMTNLGTNSSVNMLFPRERPQLREEPDVESSLSIPIVNNVIAFSRWIFYRPIPSIRIGKRHIRFSSAGVVFVTFAAFSFVILYSFLPQPLYYSTIRYGSPPLATRAGMLSVAMVPWIVALSMKANLVSVVTGMGHERLNVLHRWGGYICLVLALIHTVPYYITPVSDQGALEVFKNYFQGQYYIYGTGVAALAPLIFLCVHSLPFIRSKMYELFVVLHVPATIVFLGMMFWHCHNYLTSWHYLWATTAIWVLSLIFRLFYLNWLNYWRMSWLCGEESAVTILPENAVKVTIPTQVKWRPGQFVYLRMPGISIFENHPFTIASLCSDDFPSDYGEQYRDMVLVFRPFGGFTQKVVNTALQRGPYHTYRAFIDGPYGGMRRELASFETVVLIAGGSGITAIVSHLLLLIKKMRDGTAATREVHVIWALKRPETAEWFKEELRICRQHAPPDSVHCQFFITAAKRHKPQPSVTAVAGAQGPDMANARPTSTILHERINDAFQGIASKRNSALVREGADGDAEREKELQRETQDQITSLPQAHLVPSTKPSQPTLHTPGNATHQQQQQPQLLTAFPPPPRSEDKSKSKTKPHHRKQTPSMKIEIPSTQQSSSFDFGFPSTPTNFQKNLMRFAFLPGVSSKRGWHTEYGRPDIPFMLRGLRKDFRRRACVFVCGPPGMREDVQRCVAGMQSGVWRGEAGEGGCRVDEIFLHTENYAI